MRNDSFPLHALRLLSVVLLVSGLGGCSALQNVLGEQRPAARIAGAALKDVTLTSATLVFDVEVDNPYAVSLPLVNLDYSLASGDRPFLAGKAELQGTVPARSTKVLSLPAQITYLEALRALKGVAPGAVVPYVAELGLSVEAPALGVLRLPLRKEGRLPVPAAPSVSIPEIAWDQLTLDKAVGRVRLSVTNHNSFPVELSGLRYVLHLGDVEVADASLARSVSLAADGRSGTVDIPLSLSPRKAAVGLLTVLAGSDAAYQLAGMMDVTTEFGPMSLPIQSVGRALLSK